jgi:hypothetical protein
MVNLKDFAKQAKVVAEKRAWAKLAFAQLLEAMSAEVADVTDNLPDIHAELLDVSDEDEPVTTVFYLTYISQDDARFSITRSVRWDDGKYGQDTGDYKPSVSQIRDIAPKIPEAVESILHQLREFGTTADDAKATIDALLAKLKA